MEALQKNRYLSGLDNEILEYLAQHTHLISYDAEESIIREGSLARVCALLNPGG